MFESTLVLGVECMEINKETLQITATGKATLNINGQTREVLLPFTIVLDQDPEQGIQFRSLEVKSREKLDMLKELANDRWETT